jgi:hypothetical protein
VRETPRGKGRITLLAGQDRLFAETELTAELPPEQGFVKVEKVHLFTAARRCSPFELELMVFIAARTTSARKPRPEYARIEMEEWRAYTGRPERTIALALQRLEKRNVVIRSNPDSKTHRGGYKLAPEAIHTMPLRPPRVCQPRGARQAKVAASSVLAAFDRPSAECPVPQAAAEPSVLQQAVEPGEAFSAAGAEGRRKDDQVLQTSAELPKLTSVAEQLTEQSAAQAPVARLVAKPARALTPQELHNFRNQWEENLQPRGRNSATFCPIGLRCPYDPGTWQHAKKKEEGTDLRTPISKSVGGVEGPEPTLAEIEAVRDLLTGELAEKLKSLPSDSHCRNSTRNMQGAPLTDLRKRIDLRRHIITSYGLVEHLAKEVGDAYVALQRRGSRERPAPADANPRCAKCQDTGVIGGFIWNTLADLRGIEAERFCACSMGLDAKRHRN